MGTGKLSIIFAIFAFALSGHAKSVLETRLQINLYQALIDGADEMVAEQIADKTIYKTPEIDRYEKVFKKICAFYRSEKCPEVYFTQKPIGLAAMYPNGVLLIEPRVAAGLNENELSFFLAHEFGHFYLN